MKKKIKKQKAPAYAFGINGATQPDTMMNIMNGSGAVIDAVGTGLTAASSDDGTSKGSVAGSALKGAGTGAALGASLGSVVPGIGTVIGGAVGAVGGGLAGFFTGKSKRNNALTKKKHQATEDRTNAGLNTSSTIAQEYWNDNSLAYTYANGGMLPNVAYVDNNEIIRANDGSIAKVPNTTTGTDNHLIDATNLESVLSDKLKRPGTKNTFAKEGQILSKMTKPSKGKDLFARNTDKLNKINANIAYDKLLTEQEEVKAAKGIKPKVKGIPAYEDGKNRNFWNTPILDQISGLINNNASDIFNRQVLPINSADAVRYGIPYGRNENVLNTPINTLGTRLNYNRAANKNTAIQMGSPTTGAWFTPSQYNSNQNGVDAVTYANDEPISVTSYNTPASAAPTTVSSTKTTYAAPSTKSTKKAITTKSATQYNFVDTPMINVEDYNPYIRDAYTQPIPSTFSNVSAAKPDLSPISNKVGTKGKSNTSKPTSSFSPDWLSLAPTVYNAIMAMKGSETEPTVRNPYTSSITDTMARRRSNVDQAMLANSRSRAISNYNLANLNANTGANLATRAQAAVDEYVANANLYASKQNTDNAYLGEYANTLNNLGQQYVQSRTLTNDLNARNRSAARNYGATAMEQVGKWSQVNKLMKNQQRKDDMLMPFLSTMLSEGFTQDQVNNLWNQYKNKQW